MTRKERKVWRFTEARKNSLRAAQKEHVILVRLGKKARARGMK